MRHPIALALLLVAGAIRTAEAKAPEADRVVETLRAANQARAENAREAREWREEQARLRLLADTLRAEAGRLDDRAAELKAEIARLEAGRDADSPAGARLAALGRVATAQAQRIHDALDALERRLLPGTIEPRPDGAPDLSAARSRLVAAERAAEQVSVSLVTGQLAGKPLRVELLRVGGAVGWWCSLEGRRAGVARVEAGQLRLEAPPAPQDVETILTACRIAKGRAAPELLPLPIAAAAGADR